MLTDAKLKTLRGGDRGYKIADRDGLYVVVSTTGGISFRYNYRINGRQETVTLGKYGVGGMALREAREALAIARKAVSEGVSPPAKRSVSYCSAKRRSRFLCGRNSG